MLEDEKAGGTGQGPEGPVVGTGLAGRAHGSLGLSAGIAHAHCETAPGSSGLLRGLWTETGLVVWTQSPRPAVPVCRVALRAPPSLPVSVPCDLAWEMGSVARASPTAVCHAWLSGWPSGGQAAAGKHEATVVCSPTAQITGLISHGSAVTVPAGGRGSRGRTPTHGSQPCPPPSGSPRDDR